MNIRFDKKIELFLGLLYSINLDYNIGPTGYFKETIPSYCKDFYSLYKKYASDELIDYIKNGGMDTYNRTVEIAISLDDHYAIIETDEIKNIEKTNLFFNREILERLIKEFVEKSSYEKFFDNYKNAFDHVINKYRASLNKYVVFNEEIMAEFYGQKKNMQIILINFINGSFGLENNDSIINVQCVRTNNNQEVEFGTRIVSTSFHEFSHPYINPLGYKYFGNIDLHNLVIDSINNGLERCYGKTTTIINEYVVRAVQVYLCRIYMENDYILRELARHKNLGFNHIEDIIDLLEQKKKYTLFEDFYKNEIVPYFINLNISLENQIEKNNKTFK